MGATLLFIFLSCYTAAFGISPKVRERLPITLLNSEGTKTTPKDLNLDASWIGLAVLSDGSNDVSCPAVHVNTETVTLHSDCFPKSGSGASLTLHYWNKLGTQTKVSLSAESLGETSDHPVQSVKLPAGTGEQWKTSGDVAKHTDELWFGGFHPDWELVRVYSFEEDLKTKSFRFQVNTCKAALQSPSLRRVKLATEDDDEEVVSESRLIPKDSKFTSHRVLEKCLRPLSKSSRGTLITLARDFSQKIGFLVQSTFEGIPQRDLAGLQNPPKFQDGTLLRYIGADGLEIGLPKNPSAIDLNLSYPFENLFPRKEK